MMTVEILQGDCMAVLPTLTEKSVHCVITSPPYWGLRDYGIPDQLGLEATPEEYVEKLVAVFRDVRRVLRDDGTLWLNLGDCYNAARNGGWAGGKGALNTGRDLDAIYQSRSGANVLGLKPKDLVGIPWRVALALQADGWWLRSDIIWSKPNAMPESVIDRPTRAHEYVFLLSKSKTYYDAAAIREPEKGDWGTRDRRHGERFTNGVMPNGQPHKGLTGKPKQDKQRGHGQRHAGFNDRWDSMTKEEQQAMGANKRSVWEIATQPFPGAHFATFPEALVKPCLLAGCPPEGKRCDCDEIIATPTGSGPIADPSLVTGRAGMNRPRRDGEGSRPITKREQRWHAGQLRAAPAEAAMICGSAFGHYIRTDDSGARPLPEAIRRDFIQRGWITEAPPCECPVESAGTVLDPFAGSGTVGVVSRKGGRNAILIELSEDYCQLMRDRMAQAMLL